MDFGNYLYQEYSAGLFQMPLNLGILLTGITLFSKEKKNSLKKHVCALLLVGIVILGYIDFLLGGIHIRYVCDLSLAVSLLAFLALLEYIPSPQTRSARILYALALGMLVLTVGQGWLTIFSNETNAVLKNNPDFYLTVGRMFYL